MNKPIPQLTEKQLSRFWAKVDKSNSCWVWTACVDKDGYGEVILGGSKFRAHRVSYAIAKGDPEKLCVCHKYDNRLCVNPDHLWLGTIQEDMKDRDEKGRTLRGEQIGLASRQKRGVIQGSGDNR